MSVSKKVHVSPALREAAQDFAWAERRSLSSLIRDIVRDIANESVPLTLGEVESTAEIHFTSDPADWATARELTTAAGVELAAVIRGRLEQIVPRA